MGWLSFGPLFPHRRWIQPSFIWVCSSPASQIKYEACWSSPETTPPPEDRNTVYTLTIIYIQTDACACTVYENVSRHVRSCAFCVLCAALHIWLPSQSCAEEPCPLIKSDEWLKIVRPTPLSLSKGFYLILQGILRCDVASGLLS